MIWGDLKYWDTDEYQVIEEKLRGLDKQGVLWCPGKKRLFAAMGACPLDRVRCVIMGQDPYPDPGYATGLAFSVPRECKPEKFPPTLRNIYREYVNDLHYPSPSHGDLSSWARRGVFLWNAIPSCTAFHSGSHRWPEWEALTEEIVQTLDRQCIVFILMGRYARDYARLIVKSSVIETSHPSPLGVRYGFLGSRIFTTANFKLCELGLDPIEWRIPDDTKPVQT